nr:hypothetical protein [Enterovibrio nigricans]
MKIEAHIVSYPLKRPFTISRGSRTNAEVIQVRIEHDGNVGVGECSPTGRYGESFDSVLVQITSMGSVFFDRSSLQSLLPAGAARNAIDCALWDLGSPRFPDDVFHLPSSIKTAMTVSINSANAMAEEAKA